MLIHRAIKYIVPNKEKHLKHELGHVIQQKRGLVKPTHSIAGIPVNDDFALEQDADTDVDGPFSEGGYTNVVQMWGEYSQQDIFNLAQQNYGNAFVAWLNQHLTEVDAIRAEVNPQQRAKWMPNWITGGMNNFILTRLRQLTQQYIKDKSTNNIKEYLNNQNYSADFRADLEGRIDEIIDSLSPNEVFNTNSAANQQTLRTWILARHKAFFGAMPVEGEGNIDTILQGNADISGGYTFGLSGEKGLPDILASLSKAEIQQFTALIARLRAVCDAETIKEIILSASTNVARSMQFLFPINSNWAKASINEIRSKKTFINRLRLMTTFLENIPPEIKDEYNIKTTGSDPHIGGKHALFLNAKENDTKRVYKPRSLAVDNALVGSNGILAWFNQQFATDEATSGNDKYKFATMDIDTEHKHEEKAEKVGTMNVEEAKKYFFRAGMLQAMALVLGIDDLHVDNMMPTRNGPLIIDAEVSFSRFFENNQIYKPEDVTDIMTNQNRGASCTGQQVRLSVSENTNPATGAPSNTSFKIGKDDSAGEFKKPESQYKANFHEGYQFMKNFLSSKKDELGTVLNTKLSSVDSMRIVPISTGELQHMLWVIRSTSVFDNPETADYPDYVKCLKGHIYNKLQVFIDKNQKYRIVFIEDDLIWQRLLTTFNQGLIPCFEFYMGDNLGANSGKILLDYDGVNIDESTIGEVKVGTEDDMHTASKGYLIQRIVQEAKAKIDML